MNSSYLANDRKLKVWAYDSSSFTSLVPGMTEALNVTINPSSYTRTFKPLETEPIVIGNGQVVGRKIVDPPMEEFKMQLWFDGTGTIGGTGEVNDDIDKFKRYALLFNGKIHSQNFIKLEWGGAGDLTFKGQLKSLQIEYTLFDRDGKPLRAKADATFIQVMDEETRKSLKKESSPDLTHVRTVRAGDNLPLMCYRIYGRSDYYIQVATANGLQNVIFLEPGQKIVFPPLEK